MEILLLVICAFGASWLTFLSGFGLGTILTPVFYFVFNDLPLAIAATAVVHFLNNVFKFILMKKKVDWKIAAAFGLACVPAAMLGAWCLTFFEDQLLFSYRIGTMEKEIYLMNLVFGLLLIFFSLMEIVPRFELRFGLRKLWIGGLISGFFGGLSGHQGALRTAFLSPYKLDKETFIATGIVIALAVDISRTGFYFKNTGMEDLAAHWVLISATLIAALSGAITGKYFLRKMDLKILNVIIGCSMFIFGVLLAAGFLTQP